MNILSQKNLSLSLLLALASLPISTKAQAIVFSFSQDNFLDFSGNTVGSLSGSFEFDTSSLSTSPNNLVNESILTSFSASYSSPNFSTQTFTLSDPILFSYDLGADIFDTSDDQFLEFSLENASGFLLSSFSTGTSQETFIMDIFTTFEQESSMSSFNLSTDNPVDVPTPLPLFGSLVTLGCGILRKKKLQH